MTAPDVVDPVLPPVRLPPSPPIPKTLQAVLAVTCWRQLVAWLTRRYGAAFTLHVPLFGTAVVVTEPELARQVYLADPADVGVRTPNQITRVVGASSVFGLNGDEHRRRRDLLSPLFHGGRLRGHESAFVTETLAEIANWPDDGELQTYPAMSRIALNTILRALFGTAGPELDELRRVMPPLVKLGSRLAVLPKPARTFGRRTPWGRLARLRARYDAAVEVLINRARVDPNIADRTDVLAVLLRGNTDGDTLSREEIGDELLGLIGTGESVAAQLAWAFERISRCPGLLADLTAEADAGGNTLRRATIREVQRTRSLSGFTGRYVYAPVFRLGEWVVPHGCVLRVAVGQVHRNPAIFTDPDRFDPGRFLHDNPGPFDWIPYGGGARRCPGSAFANLEMDLVLRTVLQQFTIEQTAKSAEKWAFRGVVYAPEHGGLITVHRRSR